MLDDLKLNLLSEAIGIFFTVLILDRLFRWREEKRWEPVKHGTYTMITEVTTEMFRHLLPIENRTEPGLVYVFGTHHVPTMIGLHYESENLTENLRERFRENPDYFYEQLDYYEDKYEDIIESRLFLLTEELAEILLDFPHTIERMKSRLNEPVPDSIELDDEMKAVVEEGKIRGIELIILMAFSVLGLMKGKADAILTVEEFEERMDPDIVFNEYNTAYRSWRRARWTQFKVWPRYLKVVVKRRHESIRDRVAAIAGRLQSFRD